MITRGEQMLALRKKRMAAAHPFLRGGFRPFFFGGPAWAVFALGLWLFSLAGQITLPTAFDPLAWHRHEMLFGFVGAVICGFLLTAIPNWTGRLPIAGGPLAGLFGFWLAARLAVLFSGVTGRGLAALFDAGFFLVVAVLAAREVLESKNRNLPIVGMVLLFGLADAADHASAAGLIGGDIGWQFAIALVVLLISLVGGRIMPSFTRNWMAKQGITDGLPSAAWAVRPVCDCRHSIGVAWVDDFAPWANHRRIADWRSHASGGAAGALGRRAGRFRSARADPPCRLRVDSHRTAAART